MARTFTAQEILHNLDTNSTWVERAVVALWRRQTADEQAAHTTNTKNGMGFNGVDAEILTSFAEQIQGIGIDWQGRKRTSGRSLSEKQLAVARKKLPKYVGQLLDVAAQAAQAPAAPAKAASPNIACPYCNGSTRYENGYAGWCSNCELFVSERDRHHPQAQQPAAVAAPVAAQAQRRPVWYALTDDDAQMLQAYWLRGLLSVDEMAQACMNMVGYLPAFLEVQVPTPAQPAERPAQASTDAPAADGGTDEFDTLFPRMAPARATHVGQQTPADSIVGWAEGVYGNMYTPGRKGWARKTQATSHMSNRALATAVERMRY